MFLGRVGDWGGEEAGRDGGVCMGLLVRGRGGEEGGGGWGWGGVWKHSCSQCIKDLDVLDFVLQLLGSTDTFILG